MAYYNGYGFTDITGKWRYQKTDRIYCNDCAETSIPLPPKRPRREGESDFEHAQRAGGQRHHDTGFKWAPYYGATCIECGRPA